MIKCQDPKFILNKRLYYHPNEVVCVYFNGKLQNIRPFYLQGLRFLKNPFFRPKQAVQRGDLTQDNIDHHYVVLEDGTCEPLYMVVPCGHCTLCRERKKQDWVIRASAETQCYENNPYFVTLTYNDKNIPEEGVNLEHIQKFLKRFRVNLARTLELDYSEIHLRVMYCAEYGHNTHRAHYHLIFWNLPLCLHASAIHALVKLSWSSLRGHKARKEWKKNFMWYHGQQEEYKGELIFQHCTKDVPGQYGFVYTKKADSGCCGYICKYMQKDCLIPFQKYMRGLNKGKFILDDKGNKQLCNPCFFHCSRRGGSIGAPYLPTVIDQYLCDEEYNKIIINDKFNQGLTTEGSFPAYFRNKLTPTLQMGIKYDNYHKFERLNVLAYGLTHTCEEDTQYLNYFQCFVDNHPVFKEFVKKFYDVPQEYYDLTDLLEPRDIDVYDDTFNNNRKLEFDQLLYDLESMDVDYVLLSKQMIMRCKHSNVIRENAILFEMSATDITEESYRIEQRNIKAKTKEIL